jgi:hypothetical protein
MTKLVNRAKMTTATTGTGTITLGSAVDGYQTFASAGVVNADVVRYVIEDGNDWEIGLGTYNTSGTILSRNVDESSTGNLLNLSGSAVVYATAAADDIGSPVYVAETPPANPEDGDLWFRTTDAAIFIYYDDGSSAQWVGLSGFGASTLDDLTDVVITSATAGQVLKFDGANWVNGTDDGGTATIRRHDWTGTYAYCGTAPDGSAESDEVWDISRIEISGSGSVIDTTYASNVAWTDRTTASYS